MKLENLLMSEDGLKIADFGVAIQLDANMQLPYNFGKPSIHYLPIYPFIFHLSYYPSIHSSNYLSIISLCHLAIPIGGNDAHFAPEILNTRPGPGRVLNYQKQPVWAAGVLAYELAGHGNPFQNPKIDQRAYDVRSLPPLSSTYCQVRTLLLTTLT